MSRHASRPLVVLSVLAVALAGLVACSSGDDTPAATLQPTATSAVARPSTPTLAPAATPTRVPNTPVPVASQPPPASTLAPAATSTPLPPGPDADTLMARGKALFEKDAGGVGCALCHGLDGKGKPELATPSNRGASEQLIWNALETRAQMTFMLGTLSSDDVRAISAYLAELATQP